MKITFPRQRPCCFGLKLPNAHVSVCGCAGTHQRLWGGGAEHGLKTRTVCHCKSLKKPMDIYIWYGDFMYLEGSAFVARPLTLFVQIGFIGRAVCTVW